MSVIEKGHKKRVTVERLRGEAASAGEIYERLESSMRGGEGDKCLCVQRVTGEKKPPGKRLRLHLSKNVLDSSKEENREGELVRYLHECQKTHVGKKMEGLHSLRKRWRLLTKGKNWGEGGEEPVLGGWEGGLRRTNWR